MPSPHNLISYESPLQIKSQLGATPEFPAGSTSTAVFTEIKDTVEVGTPQEQISEGAIVVTCPESMTCLLPHP